MKPVNQPCRIVIGASSGIAQALIARLLQSEQRVIAISRGPCPEPLVNTNVAWHQTNYDEANITQCANILMVDCDVVHSVYLCHGQLHDAEHMPEKKIEDLDTNYLQKLYLSNTVTPMLWLKALMPLLSKQTACRVTVFSARVGSVSDNRLGGWYGYRASKAALNMMLKTASVELKRRAKGVKLVSFHPGTTDTSLSKPFQKNVPEGKLFTPDFVAQQLLAIESRLVLDGELSYLDWQGQEIPF